TEWRRHARGRIRPVGDDPTHRIGGERVPRAAAAIAPQDFYEKFAALHITLGTGWQWLESACSSSDAATARVGPPARETSGVAPLQPVVLDHGILTALLLAVSTGADTRPLLPFSIERLRWWKAPMGSIGTAAVQRSHGEDAATFEFSLLDEDGSPIAEVDGF